MKKIMLKKEVVSRTLSEYTQRLTKAGQEWTAQLEGFFRKMNFMGRKILFGSEFIAGVVLMNFGCEAGEGYARG